MNIVGYIISELSSLLRCLPSSSEVVRGLSRCSEVPETMYVSEGPRRLSTVSPRRDPGYSKMIRSNPRSSEVLRAPPRYSKVLRASPKSSEYSEVLRGPGASRNHPELFRTLRNPAKKLYLWSVITRYNTTLVTSPSLVQVVERRGH